MTFVSTSTPTNAANVIANPLTNTHCYFIANISVKNILWRIYVTKHFTPDVV